MSVAMKINEELKGIELYFNRKPQQNVLDDLKTNGFRWSNYKKCWYTKQSERAFQIANSLTAGEKTVSAIKEKTTKKQIINLWNATRFTDIAVNKEQDLKEIAKEIRTNIRKRFPQCKFSVTVPYYGKINFEIKSSPYEKESVYLKEIIGYCTSLLDAYRKCYDPADSYSDYGGSYNFHGWVSISYDYTQIEATEEVKKDMQEFDIKLGEFEKAEEEKRRQEFQEWQKQRELEEIEFKKQQEEEKKQVEFIYNSTDVKTLDENNQYFIMGSEFAHLNKNNTLKQYKEEVLKGEYSLEDVKITRELHFNSEEALENFSNMLLNDFDFLNDTGGSFTEDNRVNSMTDFYNMDKDERETVKWYLKGVAVYFDNKLQFIVDAQGYSYARYVGLTENAKIEKSVTVEQMLNDEELKELQHQAAILEDISVSVIEELEITKSWNNERWKEYKEVFKSKLIKYEIVLTREIIQQLEIEELKVRMYKLLTEVESIRDQFAEANIQKGEQLTLFYISDWGSIVTQRLTFDSVENEKYAQYSNAVRLTFTPEKKRKLHYKHFYSTLLVYKGWHKLPNTVLNHVEEKNSMRITRSKYHSCDKKQYDEILTYFDQHDIRPIVNTYKPQF